MDGSQAPGPLPAAALSTPAAPPRRWRRRLLLGAALLLAIAVGGVYGQRWWTTLRFLESTDDAYVQADAVAVSPRVAGEVAQVLVSDNQRVRAGDVLARLDDRDLRAALDQARADVAAAEADVAGFEAQTALQGSTIAAAGADIAAADATLGLARAEYARYIDLQRTGSGTVQRAQQAEADIRAREAAAARARAAAEGTRQQLAVLEAGQRRAEATLARARANARQAELNLSYATIASPIDGAIGDRSLRAGQYVQPGTRVLSVVPQGSGLYVVANFKETQLARMFAGEAVSLSVDMLPDVTLSGHVNSLAPGSGATFALLPPENATGNFTKIVQRVPVKVTLDPTPDLDRLRPGLSVTAAVDTRTRPSGPVRTLVER